MKIGVNEIRDKVIAIVKEDINIDLSGIDPYRDIREQFQIDSIQLVAIFAAIVEKFQIDIPFSIMTAKTFKEILDGLESEITNKRITKGKN